MKFLKFDVFTSFSSNIYRKSCLLPQRLWPLTSQTAPPLSGSGKPPYGAKHLAVAPTLLTTSQVELISWSELRLLEPLRPLKWLVVTQRAWTQILRRRTKRGRRRGGRRVKEGTVVTRGSHWSARWFPVSSYWLQKVPMSTQGSTGAEAEEGAEEGQAGHALFQCRGL